MKIKKITHKFVEYIPDELEEGVLYISTEFATASHKCACGCGERVVTPIRSTDWELIWGGDSVSLYPSIGNWDYSCESHYWIKKNNVVWSYKMSKSMIEFGRKEDKKMKEKYYKKSKK